MILKLDKKEVDLFKEACIYHGLSFKEYTNETNELMVTAEILIDGNIEPSQSLCVYLGRAVQMNWQKQVENETEIFKSAYRGTTQDLPQRE